MKRIIIFIIVVIGIIGLIVGLLSMPIFKSSNVVSDFNGEIKEFDIIAKKWEFNPEVINVNKGDKVILNIKSLDVPHGIALFDFGVKGYLAPGKETKIEFIAGKSGEFDFFCNVYCGSGHGGMKGKLIVN